MIHAITLNRSQQHDRRGRTTVNDEETIQIWIRLSRLQGIFSLPYAFGQYFLVILAIDSATDVRVGIEFGGWKCLENWVRREKMVWVTFGCKVGVTGGEVERAYW
jgi:hypothetical protein